MQSSTERNGKIGYLGTAAIGIGGMVGGGIFAVLGLAVQLSRGGAPLAFLLAGLVALVTAYSYARLSVTYPSQGGTVIFLDKAFGSDLFTGGINILLWLSYIVMLSLYSSAFGSYGAALFPAGIQPIVRHVLITFIILIITALNMLSANLISKAESWIVAIKLLILLLFVGIGLGSIKLHSMAPVEWSPPVSLIAGGMIIFLAYEGFELIANTAHDVKNPKKTLPRAFYSSVIFVIVLYMLVSAVAVGNLSVDQVVAGKEYALAVAARPFMGQTGFILIAVAAMLSTASAINATLYGAGRLSYTIAKEGELPPILEKKVWHRPIEGLLITAGVNIIIANFFDLSSISIMGSAGFLLIFAAVNASNFKLYKKTGGNRLISILGMIACLSAMVALVWQTYQNDPRKLWVLVIMAGISFLIEGLYRIVGKREMKIKHIHVFRAPDES